MKEEIQIGNYKVEKTIGSGTFGKVKLGFHSITQEKVAVKVLEKSKINHLEDIERVKREINFLKKLNHPNVIKLLEILENNTSLFLVMEYAGGGELFNHIVKKRRLSEQEASFFFYQIVEGLESIHKNNIVHRDLKPENLLFNEHKQIKIIDFGLSNNYFDGAPLLATPCGSPCYAAPEMVLGKKYSGVKVDTWSLGIILFAMTAGYLPFEDQNNEKLFKKIVKCNIEFPSFVSQNSIDMINLILDTNPDTRISLNEIKEQQFYLQGKSLYNKHMRNRYSEIYGSFKNSFIESLGDPLINKNYYFQIRKQCEMLVKKFVLEKMVKDLKYKQEEILGNIEADKHNNITATFHLLVNKYMSDNYLLEVLFEKEEQRVYKEKESVSRKISSKMNEIRASINTQPDELLINGGSSISNFNRDKLKLLHKESINSSLKDTPNQTYKQNNSIIKPIESSNNRVMTINYESSNSKAISSLFNTLNAEQSKIKNSSLNKDNFKGKITNIKNNGNQKITSTIKIINSNGAKPKKDDSTMQTIDSNLNSSRRHKLSENQVFKGISSKDEQTKIISKLQKQPVSIPYSDRSKDPDLLKQKTFNSTIVEKKTNPSAENTSSNFYRPKTKELLKRVENENINKIKMTSIESSTVKVTNHSNILKESFDSKFSNLKLSINQIINKKVPTNSSPSTVISPRGINKTQVSINNDKICLNTSEKIEESSSNPINLLKMSANKQPKVKTKNIGSFAASSNSKDKKIKTNLNLNLDKIKEEVEAAKERIRTITIVESPKDLKHNVNSKSKYLITDPSNINKEISNLRFSHFNKGSGALNQNKKSIIISRKDSSTTKTQGSKYILNYNKQDYKPTLTEGEDNKQSSSKDSYSKKISIEGSKIILGGNNINNLNNTIEQKNKTKSILKIHDLESKLASIKSKQFS